MLPVMLPQVDNIERHVGLNGAALQNVNHHQQPNTADVEIAQDNQPTPPSMYSTFAHFLSRKPLLLSCLGTAIFSTASTISLTLEYNSSCRPDLKLWLIVSVARSVMRIVLKILVEMRVREICMTAGSAPYLMKTIEMLDVFGLVWFSVGNLLVFNGPRCADEMPAIFFTCCAYIISVYVFLFVPTIFKLCLRTRPLPVNERAELEEAILRALERTLQREQVLGQAVVSGGEYHTLSKEVTAYWLKYLQEKCNIQECKTYAEMQARRSAVGEPPCDLTFCSICLDELAEGPGGPPAPSMLAPSLLPAIAAAGDVEDESNSLTLVSFPCAARHVFHTPCLLSWLEAATVKHNRASCPICRDPLPVHIPRRSHVAVLSFPSYGVRPQSTAVAPTHPRIPVPQPLPPPVPLDLEAQEGENENRLIAMMQDMGHEDNAALGTLIGSRYTDHVSSPHRNIPSMLPPYQHDAAWALAPSPASVPEPGSTAPAPAADTASVDTIQAPIPEPPQ